LRKEILSPEPSNIENNHLTKIRSPLLEKKNHLLRSQIPFLGDEPQMKKSILEDNRRAKSPPAVNITHLLSSYGSEVLIAWIILIF
jgi:hypothetical protein